jgi:hypothetical protein
MYNLSVTVYPARETARDEMEVSQPEVEPAVLSTRVVPQVEIPQATIPTWAEKPQGVEAESTANE